MLEKDGKGLNLTMEVRDGIVNHKKSGHPSTLEGKCVSLADRIAYINHDLNDAVRAGILSLDDVPKEIFEVLGKTSKQRINTAILSIYKNSDGINDVKMDKDVETASENLRSFMFKQVYYSSTAKREEEKAERMLTEMYVYYMEHVEELPETYVDLLENYPREQVVCDYLSSMTDRYAIYMFNCIFVPKGWTFIDEK